MHTPRQPANPGQMVAVDCDQRPCHPSPAGGTLCGMETPHIQVRVDSESLRHALEGFLRHAVNDNAILDDGQASVPKPTDVVITTDSSCPPEACQHLSRQARAVIVLAAVPRASAQDLYFHAGAAAYLPMDATGESLTQVLQTILSHPPGD